MENKGSRNLVRPEAGPILFENLQKRAQEALNRIIPALRESAALAASDVTNKPQSRSEIDTNRASRLFFVSGEPGSGKSTIYLTLRAMTSSEERFKDYGTNYKNQTELGYLRSAVQWLEPLDLEVAGDERDNLLAAVLVRLFDVLDRSSGILSKQCEEAIKELEVLAMDIGIAWEGNLRKRAGALDPATYSEEVMLAQRARLGVNHRLRQALEEIAIDKCCKCHGGTLFILPVEDFYLKPDASLQLLRLLRMISVPRLFFLLLGDIKTVEALFTEKSLADWTAVAGTRTFAGGEHERLNRALSRARELRARYLRKLLPPGQRVEIEAMDWHEALDIEVGRAETDSNVVEVFQQTLKRVELDPYDGVPSRYDSLLNFLISPSMPPLTSKEREKRAQRRISRARGEKGASLDSNALEVLKARAAYTALQILDATPREVIDLGSALREVMTQRQELSRIGDSDAVKNPVLLLCVRNLVNLVIEEQSFLDSKEQEILEGVLPTRSYAPEYINCDMKRLSLVVDSWPSTKKTAQWWVRKQRSWDLGINPDLVKPDDDPKTSGQRKTNSNGEESQAVEGSRTDPFHKLPPRPAAWLILLHDLAWVWKPESLTKNLVKALCDELNKKKLSEEKLDDFRGWAAWYDDSEKTYKHFPMPNYRVFRDLDRFLYVWSRALERLEKRGELQDADVQKISALWALSGWTVLTESYEDFAKEGDKWFEKFEVTSAATLQGRLEEFWKGRTKKKHALEGTTTVDINKWLTRASAWPLSK